VLRDLNQYSQSQLLSERDLSPDKLTAEGSTGKSGSIFVASNNKVFFLKSIEKRETKCIVSMIRDYYQHLKKFNNCLLMKILGFYRHNGMVGSTPFIMFNNFFNVSVSIDEKYDLKGSKKDREATVKEKAKSTPVLLDLDFSAINRKLYFGKSKDEFLEQLNHDAKFLARFNCMDYSFLVGIHKIKDGEKLPEMTAETMYRQSNMGRNVCHIVSSKKDEIYFVGIIDHFTIYDTEKKVANRAKSLKYVQDDLSTVNAQHYCTRFCTFISSIIE